MGLFSRKNKKPHNGMQKVEGAVRVQIEDIWNSAYQSKANFYSKDGKVFGAFALTENTDTILQIRPSAVIDGRPVKDWRLSLVSTTEGLVIGNVDYCKAVVELEQSAFAASEDRFLIKGLSLERLRELAAKYPI